MPVAEKLEQSKPPISGADSHARELEHRQMLWASYMAMGDVEQDISNKRSWYEKARKSASDAYQEDQKSAAKKLLEEREKNPLNESQAKKDLDQTLKALLELHRRTPK